MDRDEGIVYWWITPARFRTTIKKEICMAFITCVRELTFRVYNRKGGLNGEMKGISKTVGLLEASVLCGLHFY